MNFLRISTTLPTCFLRRSWNSPSNCSGLYLEGRRLENISSATWSYVSSDKSGHWSLGRPSSAKAEFESPFPSAVKCREVAGAAVSPRGRPSSGDSALGSWCCCCCCCWGLDGSSDSSTARAGVVWMCRAYGVHRHRRGGHRLMRTRGRSMGQGQGGAISRSPGNNFCDGLEPDAGDT